MENGAFFLRGLAIDYFAVNAESKELHTYALSVLGCKVNQYDARLIARLFEGFGLRTAARGEVADLISVHTCGVTATAVQKSRQALRRLIRKHPGSTIFMTGCAATKDLAANVDAIDVRVAAGAGWVQKIADELQAFSLPNPDFRLPADPDELAVESFGGQTRAFLKIQDGCDAECAYCIVPTLRKAPRDKSIESAVSEAGALVRRGYKEIVMTGVHVGLYGRGADYSLSDVLRRILSIPDLGRIRMSSLHPAELTDALLDVWASTPHMMPHLHLSLQSGAVGVLRRMKRGYTAEEYAAAVARTRQALDHPAITTDVIVGFPGETDEEFEETLAFCRKIGFAGMHIFNYSPRPGTPAAEMPNPVAPRVAAERHQRLQALAEEMSLEFNRTFVGEIVEVLVEGCRSGICAGHCRRYIPVRFPGSAGLRKKVVSVCITSVDAVGLTGKMIERGRVSN